MSADVAREDREDREGREALAEIKIEEARGLSAAVNMATYRFGEIAQEAKTARAALEGVVDLLRPLPDEHAPLGSAVRLAIEKLERIDQLTEGGRDG